jgi:hypothetical protein
MAGSIARIVAQFKQSWSRELEDDAILAACRAAGHRWRERDLGPVATVRMFLLQILYGNAACNFVPRLAGGESWSWTFQLPARRGCGAGANSGPSGAAIGYARRRFSQGDGCGFKGRHVMSCTAT